DTDNRGSKKIPIAMNGGKDHHEVKREVDEEDTPMVAELKKQLAKMGRMPEIPVNVDRPSEVISSLSSHYSANTDSTWTDAFSRMSLH
ncbi:hypothetical protein PMAYCL1PPCAC_26478, partial [Pristionchus mayeri]